MLFEKQGYQTDCVNNIVNVLENIDWIQGDFSNLNQSIAELFKQEKLQKFSKVDDKKLDILMETGTGKTFTYIKTIFEINKRFGQNKFIIVVPRRAIKLGVIQNIKLTKEYFFNEYGKHLNYIDYGSKNKKVSVELSSHFLDTDNLSVLVITNAAFNAKNNVINKPAEKAWFGNILGSTWDKIASVKPIVIIDEPHLLKGNKTTEYLDKLDTLFIRFGATFPKEKKHQLSNVVYALDSISSFNQYLVKRIRVNTIMSSEEESAIKIVETNSKAQPPNFKAFYSINNQIYKKIIYKDQDIGAVTGLEDYLGVTTTKITKNEVFFSNHTSHKLGIIYELSEEEIEGLIAATIRKHFEKEERLFNQSIKTLSLFFIPNIADFRGDEPRVKKIFETKYKKIREEFYKKTNNQAYKEYLDKDYQDGKLEVHQGYFSGDKGNKDDKEAEGVEIILNKKEELLSFDTPLRFIFSVWALQEGWDNPNVMNICKLSTTDKDISRRQQVGRGLRIVVNQKGRRLTYKYLNEDEHKFFDINLLDVFVSGKEKDFIEGIQKEINDASFSFVGGTLDVYLLKEKGLNEREASRMLNLLEDENIVEYTENIDRYQIISPVRDFLEHHRDKLGFLNDEKYQLILELFKGSNDGPEDGNKPPQKMIKIRSERLKDFKNLWESINKKSSIIYKDIQEDYIIEKIAASFNSEPIEPIEIKLVVKEYDSQQDQIIEKEQKSLGVQNFFEKSDYVSFINKFIKDEKLPVQFVIKLFNQIDFAKVKNNPKKAQNILINMIKEVIHQNVIQKISYAFDPEVKITTLQDAKGEYLKEIKYSLLGKAYEKETTPPEHFLYDTILWDSQIEKQTIMETPEKVNDSGVTVFAKLPKINIPTPYKNYNPDFAYLIQNNQGKQLFLIVETKGYDKQSDIGKEEMQKIEYAKHFFKALQKELPDVKIAYKTQINKQDLLTIVKEIEDF